MTTIPAKARRYALPAAIAVVIAIAVAALFGGQITPLPGLAQGAPTNVTVRNGANTGEVLVSWTPAFGSQANRVGWASEPDVLAANAAGNWLEAFNFVDLAAARRTYTVKRLQPGTRHAFLVATSTGSGNYNYSSWILLTTTAAPAATPCPTAAPGQHPTQPGFCPITGQPLGDGYVEIGGTFSWIRTAAPDVRYRAKVLSATTPDTITRVRQDGTSYQRTPASGRRWLQVNMELRNDLDFTVTVDGGHDFILDTDTGIAFDWTGTRSLESGYRYESTPLFFDIPENATVAILAFRPLAEWGDTNAPALFRIPIPSP